MGTITLRELLERLTSGEKGQIWIDSGLPLSGQAAIDRINELIEDPSSRYDENSRVTVATNTMTYRDPSEFIDGES